MLVEFEDDSLRVAVVGVPQTQLVALKAEEEAKVVGFEPGGVRPVRLCAYMYTEKS